MYKKKEKLTITKQEDVAARRIITPYNCVTKNMYMYTTEEKSKNKKKKKTKRYNNIDTGIPYLWQWIRVWQR